MKDEITSQYEEAKENGISFWFDNQSSGKRNFPSFLQIPILETVLNFTFGT
jgi:hypothetical protein